MLNNSKRKAQLIVVATFLLGAFSGGLATYIALKPPVQTTNTVPSITSEIDKRVGLQGDQRSQVENILYDAKKDYQKVREQARQQNDTIRETTRGKVRVLLTAEQQANFDKYMQELDAKREAKRQAEAKAK